MYQRFNLGIFICWLFSIYSYLYCEVAPINYSDKSYKSRHKNKFTKLFNSFK